MIDCSRCFWIQCNIDSMIVCLDGSIIDISFILWKTQILLFDNRCRLYEKGRTLEHIFVLKVIIFVGNNSVSMVCAGSLLHFYLFIHFFRSVHAQSPVSMYRTIQDLFHLILIYIGHEKVWLFGKSISSMFPEPYCWILSDSTSTVGWWMM